MKKLLIVLPFLFPLPGFSQAKELSWLVGKWKTQKNDTYEVWRVNGDKMTLEGISFRIVNADTLVSEKMKIRKDGGSFYYVPDIAGSQGEIFFKITSHTDKGFVAENPQHDFPKVIRYQFQSPATLKAEIEGDGKVIPFYFTKVR